MPLWGNQDNAANSVKYATELIHNGPAGSGNANKAANNTALYGNVSPGAFGSNVAIGQFAVTAVEFANTSAAEKKDVSHIGWNLRINGTGGVANLSISAPGASYTNGDLVKVSGGIVNASATISTNATGNVVSLTISNPGYGFANVSTATVAVTNATGGVSSGSGATFVPVLGGRAGRVSYETLVAMDSITSTGNTIPFHT